MCPDEVQVMTRKVMEKYHARLFDVGLAVAYAIAKIHGGPRPDRVTGEVERVR